MAQRSHSAPDLESFFDAVRRAAKRALLLDYDGTLAPFRVERDEAVPYPGIREILQSLVGAGDTRVVVISGRRAHDLPPLLGLERLPEIWGTHGWERLLPDGTYELAPLEERASAGLAEARGWVEAQGWMQHCEQKPASVAVHWRGLPPDAAGSMRDTLLAHWPALAEPAGLAVHEFDGGVELRVPGRDKGFAVRTLLGEIGPDAVVAYLGDDVTDEDAFKAIKGHGMGILVRAEYRPTAADLWLRPPEELSAFLARWQEACTAPHNL